MASCVCMVVASFNLIKFGGIDQREIAEQSHTSHDANLSEAEVQILVPPPHERTFVTSNEARALAKIVSRLELKKDLLTGLNQRFPQFDWSALANGKGAENENESVELQERAV